MEWKWGWWNQALLQRKIKTKTNGMILELFHLCCLAWLRPPSRSINHLISLNGDWFIGYWLAPATKQTNNTLIQLIFKKQSIYPFSLLVDGLRQAIIFFFLHSIQPKRKNKPNQAQQVKLINIHGISMESIVENWWNWNEMISWLIDLWIRKRMEWICLWRMKR